jgi:PEP-CTERM motif
LRKVAFTDVTPAAFITGDLTLGAFTSNISGNFSAAVPEPSSFALLTISVTVVLAFRRGLSPAIGG